MTIADLQQLNDKTIDKLDRTATEISDMISDPDVDLDDESRLIARRGVVFAELTTQSIMRAHLKASQIAVEFTAPQTNEVDNLETKLDGFIISGLKVNAMLNLIPKVIDTASKIGTRINSHTAMA